MNIPAILSLPRVRPLDLELVSQCPPYVQYLIGAQNAARGRLATPATTDFLTRAFTNCWVRLMQARDENELRAALRHPECTRFRTPLALYANCEASCQVETLILARERPGAIAKKLRHPADAIAVYEHLFFDVRWRLSDVDYIVRRAILTESERGAPETARRRITFKWLAFHSGPKALDDLSFFPEQTEKNYWRHPKAGLRRMAVAREIEACADLLVAPSTPLDAEAYAALIERLNAAFDQACPDTYPRHELEWRQQKAGRQHTTPMG